MKYNRLEISEYSSFPNDYPYNATVRVDFKTKTERKQFITRIKRVLKE